MSELEAPLREALVAKEAELPIVVSNAIWGGVELPRHLALSGRGEDPAGAAGAATLAVEQLRALVAAPLTVESRALEGALATLAQGSAGGDLLRSAAALTHHLERAAAVIEAADAAMSAVSATGEASERACAGLRRVFEGRYVGELQPQIAGIHRAGEAHLSALWALYRETAGSVEEQLPALAEYAQALLNPAAPEGLWRRYEAALERHTAAWQRVSGRCGFTPGG